MRLCAHADVEDRIHEMLIALGYETYIRPKKQPGKSKSYHAIDGAADVVIFEDDGAIAEVVRLGEYGSDRSFYYRMPADRFHTVLVRTPVFLVHETMNGPFRQTDTVFAPWSPAEEQLAERAQFPGGAGEPPAGLHGSGWHALRYSEGRGTLARAPRPSEYLRACHPTDRAGQFLFIRDAQKAAQPEMGHDTNHGHRSIPAYDMPAL